MEKHKWKSEKGEMWIQSTHYFNGDKTPVPPNKKGSLGKYNQ